MPTALLAAVLLGAVLASGCAGLYLAPAQASPPPPPASLDDLRWREVWAGLVFNGNKVGYSHLAVTPCGTGPDCFELRSEAVLRLRFLGVDKSVALAALDRVRPDLTLAEFRYRYDVDGSRLTLAGRVADDRLTVRVSGAAGDETTVLPLAGPLYPTAAVALYPVLKGLVPGAEYLYTVYSGETQRLAPVSQQVLGPEEGSLFEGIAWKVLTRLEGQETSTWIDGDGRPLLETSLGGAVVAGLEPAERARAYVTAAALNKDEGLLAFTRVASPVSVDDPSAVRRAVFRLTQLPGDYTPPSDGLQHCGAGNGGARCVVTAGPGGGAAQSPDDLGHSLAIPARHTAIRRLAAEVVGAAEGLEAVRRIVDWLAGHIRAEAVDAFSALDVLEQGRAECQGHTYLYAALARASGLPTRVVNGLVYSRELDGFLYHAWAESLVDGRWWPVDPTLHQVPADATHLKLAVGERPEDLVPLLGLLGRIQLDALSVEY